MKALHPWMTGIHIFVGLGAVFGGVAAVMNPEDPMGISTEMLRTGPFTNFLIPGLFLLIILGGGNLLAAVFTAKRVSYHGVLSGAMGAVLMGWIVIQCVILHAVGFLHVTYFLIGAAQGLLAFTLLYRQNDFPVSLLIGWMNRRRDRPS